MNPKYVICPACLGDGVPPGCTVEMEAEGCVCNLCEGDGVVPEDIAQTYEHDTDE